MSDTCAKADDLIDAVSPCEASAKHSYVEGGDQQTTQEGQCAMFTLVAKDATGNPIKRGGDIVRATMSSRPAEAVDIPPVEVKDNSDGRYTITCPTPCPGQYTVQVSMNGESLASTLSVTCRNQLRFHFDEAHCQAPITTSPDQLTITHTSRSGGHPSVLGSCGVRRGQLSWKVRINHSLLMGVFLGVIDKHRLTESHSFKQSYCWNGASGEAWKTGLVISKGISPFQANDVLQFDVDGERHTLKICNLRSGETATITGLADVELFPFFSTQLPLDRSV